MTIQRHYIRLSEANCRNCLRCVRICPTKAMTYVDHQPTIVEDECILCGQCYLVCPHSAKRLLSDLDLIKKWLNDKEEVILSIAPSFASIWPEYPKLENKLKNLGFSLIEETARGAKIVSQAYTKLIKEHKMKNIISTCCPAVVSLVEKEFPELVEQLAPVVSPMIAHGKLLKSEHPDAKVVFVSPCIAKQKEIHDERFEGIIDATISMPELASWLAESKDKDEEIEGKWHEFEGEIARIYPTPGGILKTLNPSLSEYHTVSVEGVERIKRTLKSIKEDNLEGYFFEMSACEESCLGGPLLAHVKHNEWLAQKVIREHIDLNKPVEDGTLPIEIDAKWKGEHLWHKEHSEEEIYDMLYMMGKTSKAKEFNCGMCGYETCRDKAIAVLDGKADPKLCLPMALENAESMSNLIIENTPNGIIVLNKDHTIREINPAALHMLQLDNINPKGMPIVSVLSSDEIENILNNKQKVQYYRHEYPQYAMILEHAVIHLEQVSIMILMDLTVEETREKVIKTMRQETIDVAQKVIDDQMRTVQEIASLLGETTAKSKVALTKLMKTFSDDD